MACIKRIVSTSFWTDRVVMDEFTPKDKYFMLYILTNPHTTQLGIYELPISTAAYETGYNKDEVRELLKKFCEKYHMIEYSDKTGEIFVKNYLRHSIISGGKPVMDCLLKEESKVSDKSLLQSLYDFLQTKEIQNTTVQQYLTHLQEYLNGEKRTGRKTKKANNFNGFKQRTYDFNELEKKLLEK